MNRKSFFWPVLSEEEKRLRASDVDRGSSSNGSSSDAPAAPAMPSDENYYQSEMPNQTYTTSHEAVMPSALSSIPAAPSSPVMPSAETARGGRGYEGEVIHEGDALLVLENITRSYEQADNHLVVLDGADLTVRAGEMVALVAPSGAGKSTLLHIAGLLERPSAGEIYIAGHPQGNAPDRERTLMRRNEIGFVYQFHHLLAEFSALENVALPQLIHGEKVAEAQSRALELLRYMKVDHRASHRPSELSGGEQQRVAIARAMANAPRVLLADEPTGNLDPTTSDYVFRALNSLVKQSGIAALVATHNLFLAERMDRQITLVDGKIVEL